MSPTEALLVSTSLESNCTHTRYGPPDVLQFTDVEKPTPQDNEVLIKLYAASVNPLELFNGLPQIFQAILLAPLLSGMGGKKTCFFIANINQKDLVSLKDLLEAGKTRTRHR